jgi:hypothetical protein
MRLQLQLELRRHDPPIGELTSPDGATIAFAGRLELLAALEHFTDATSARTATPRPATTDASPTDDPTDQPDEPETR